MYNTHPPVTSLPSDGLCWRWFEEFSVPHSAQVSASCCLLVHYRVAALRVFYRADETMVEGTDCMTDHLSVRCLMQDTTRAVFLSTWPHSLQQYSRASYCKEKSLLKSFFCTTKWSNHRSILINSTPYGVAALKRAGLSSLWFLVCQLWNTFLTLADSERKRIPNILRFNTATPYSKSFADQLL